MNWKRILATMLAFAMMFTMMPVVHAADTNTPLNALLQIQGLDAAYGPKRRFTNGEIITTASWGAVSWTVDTQSDNSGKKINAYATGFGAAVYSELMLTNTFQSEAVLEFQCAFTPCETTLFEGTNCYTVLSDNTPVKASEVTAQYEKYSITLGASKSIVIKLISPTGSRATCYLDISNIIITSTVSGEQTATLKLPAAGGSYTVDGETLAEDNTTISTENQAEYKLVAQPAEGYQFIGWKNGDAYINWSTEYTYSIVDGQVIQPVFAPVTDAIFGVADAKFADLAEADAYAAANSKVIVLLNNGTLPAGDYTISQGNTLLIPYDDANSVHTKATSTATPNETGNLWTNVAWEKPTAYRTLTMAKGAKLTIEGSLNVGGRHSSGPWRTVGAPSGKVGMIRMVEDSNITVTGTLYCWGYIYGGGTVTAKNGATVHENIQFADFRGGTATSGIAMSFLVFPMTQYYVQNIEVATTYEHGAVEEVWASIFLGSNNQVYDANVTFIGPDPDIAMFVPGTNGSVTKTYIPETDRLQIDVDGDGSINPMTLAMDAIVSVMGGPLNTETFVLPITNNMTININSGTTTLNQSLALLPGVKLSIAKDAVFAISKGDVLMQEGTELTEKLDENGNVVMTEKLDESGNVVKDDEGNAVMVPVMVPVMEPAFYSAGHNLIIYDRDQWLNGWIETEEGLELIDTYYVYTGSGVARMQPIAYSVTGTYTRTEADLVDAIVDINGTLIADGFIYTTVNIEPDENAGEDDLGIKFVGNTPIISSNGTGKVVMNNGAGQDMLTMQASQKGSDPVFVNLFMASARLQNADGSYLDTMGAAAGATYSYCAECDQWYAVTEEPHQVEITWVVDNASSTQEVCVGTTPVYLGEPPVKENYEFIGWRATAGGEVLETLPVATVDAVYYAIFEKNGVKGDLDGDGDADAYDLTILARHVGGIQLITDATLLANGDIDGDGDVDAYDLTTHARYVGGIIKEWP